jgi:protein SCO1/2
LLAFAALSFAAPVGSAQAAEHDHSAHEAAMARSNYSVSEQDYVIPDVELIDADGRVSSLHTVLNADEPVAVNFIFTTCRTICPVMTATFAQMQRQLGSLADGMRLVSISIDPEYDRPDVLKTYAAQFGAGGNWTFLTGDSGDIVAVLQSFDVFTGSKMNHQPVTLLKGPGDTSWTRIDGLASGEGLAREVTARLFH